MESTVVVEAHSTLVDIATIAAIVIGPIIALRLQKLSEKREGAKNRKLWVFKTLMTYRATNLSPTFVQALNLIDIEFDAKTEKPVRDAWKVLLDHFWDLGEYNNTNKAVPPHRPKSLQRSPRPFCSQWVTLSAILSTKFRLRRACTTQQDWETLNKNNTRLEDCSSK